MKKFLTMLTAVSFLSTSVATSVLNFNQTDFNQTNNQANLLLSENKLEKDLYSGIYSWTDIAIDHQIKTTSKLWVKDEVSNEKSDTTAVSKKTWDEVLMNTEKIMSSCYIALHTYTSPKYLNDVVLTLNTEKSNDLERVWEFSDTNDQWKGTGHHTSTVNLTVTAKYNQEEEVASIMYKSYIYARTAGAAHYCSTISQIKNAIFIVL